MHNPAHCLVPGLEFCVVLPLYPGLLGWLSPISLHESCHGTSGVKTASARSAAAEDMSDNEKPTTEHGSPSAYGPSQGAVAGHQGDEPPHHGMSAARYVATRFTSLKPPMSKLANPIKLIRMLNTHHWAFFGVGFFGWVWSSSVTVALCLCLIEKLIDPSTVDMGRL